AKSCDAETRSGSDHTTLETHWPGAPDRSSRCARRGLPSSARTDLVTRASKREAATGDPKCEVTSQRGRGRVAAGAAPPHPASLPSSPTSLHHPFRSSAWPRGRPCLAGCPRWLARVAVARLRAQSPEPDRSVLPPGARATDCPRRATSRRGEQRGSRWLPPAPRARSKPYRGGRPVTAPRCAHVGARLRGQHTRRRLRCETLHHCLPKARRLD